MPDLITTREKLVRTKRQAIKDRREALADLERLSLQLARIANDEMDDYSRVSKRIRLALEMITGERYAE